MRGTVTPSNPWDVMVDLFFYREPEETKEPEETTTDLPAEMGFAPTVDPMLAAQTPAFFDGAAAGMPAGVPVPTGMGFEAAAGFEPAAPPSMVVPPVDYAGRPMDSSGFGAQY